MNYYSKIGRSGEDTFSIDHVNSNTTMYSIFDGHGGREVSTHLVNTLPKILKNLINESNMLEINSFIRSVVNVFHELDEEICEMYRSGSTANIVIVTYRNRKYIYTINLGDSRAIIFNDDGILLSTKDHIPKLEEQRIKSVGGHVVNGRVNGILATSRSFGDAKLKDVDGDYWQEGPVSATPDFQFEAVTGNYILVQGSDGLFELTNNKNIIEEVNTYGMNAKTLCENASKRTNDDITCICAVI